MSYRVSHHSTSDDSFACRVRVEVEDWKRRNNLIMRLRKWMRKQEMCDEEEKRDVRRRIRKEVLKVITDVEKEKKAPLTAIFKDVYEDLSEEGKAQAKELGSCWISILGSIM